MLNLLILQIVTQGRIKKQDKKIAANLNYSDIVFPLDINCYEKIEDRFQMQVNVFGYENKVYPLSLSFIFIRYLRKKYFFSLLRDGKRDRSNGHIFDEQYLHL